MKQFPLIPIGMVLIVRIINDDKTAGGIQLPGGMVHDDYVVGEIIGTGTGDRTIMGVVIPNPVEIGDTVIFQEQAARAISYAVRRHIIDRGVTNEELDGVCIVMCENIVAKFPRKEVAGVPYDRANAIQYCYKHPLNRWTLASLAQRTDEELSVYSHKLRSAEHMRSEIEVRSALDDGFNPLEHEQSK